MNQIEPKIFEPIEAPPLDNFLTIMEDVSGSITTSHRRTGKGFEIKPTSNSKGVKAKLRKLIEGHKKQPKYPDLNHVALFALHFLHGHSHAAIASYYNTSEANIGSIIAKVNQWHNAP